MNKLISITLLLLAMTFTLVACGGEEPAASAPTAEPPTPTAEPALPTPIPATQTAVPLPTSAPTDAAVVEPADNADVDALVEALNTVGALTAYRFELEMSGSGGELALVGAGDENTPLVVVEGAFDGQNTQFTMKGVFASFMGLDPEQGLQVITVDGQSYIRGPIPLLGAPEDIWYVTDDAQSSITEPPLQTDSFIDPLTTNDVDPAAFTIIGEETLDGQQCTVYRGDEEMLMGVMEDMSSSDSVPPVTETDQVQNAEIKFWICADGYLHQMDMFVEGVDETNPDELMSITMMMRLFDHNGDITITPPADAAPLEVPSFDSTTP